MGSSETRERLGSGIRRSARLLLLGDAATAVVIGVGGLLFVLSTRGPWNGSRVVPAGADLDPRAVAPDGLRGLGYAIVALALCWWVVPQGRRILCWLMGTMALFTTSIVLLFSMLAEGEGHAPGGWGIWIGVPAILVTAVAGVLGIRLDSRLHGLQGGAIVARMLGYGLLVFILQNLYVAMANGILRGGLVDVILAIAIIAILRRVSWDNQAQCP